MFKKAIIASAVLAASTGLALANGGTYQPAPSCVHSAYVGVAVSRDFFSVDNGNNDGFGSLDLGNDGFDGELNAGLGWVFQDHYYLGAEVFGDVTNTKISVADESVKNKYNYGIDLVPGVKISDSTMLYGKVGYVRGKFTADANVEGYNFSDSTNRNGLQLGLGMETMITNNVSAKLEYDYNYFSKFSDTDTRPVVDQVKLGVAYHFMSA